MYGILNFRDHFLSICWTLKVIFRVFWKSHRYGGQTKKMWFFHFFFFDQKIQKFTVFSPWDPLFSRFLAQKNDTFNDIRAKEISKWEMSKSENCQILKSWFYTKIPKKYFFGHVFQKKWMVIFGSFFAFFSIVNIGGFQKHRKMAIFWSNQHTHVWNSQFLGSLFVDLLDAKGHFRVFWKKSCLWAVLSMQSLRRKKLSTNLGDQCYGKQWQKSCFF